MKLEIEYVLDDWDGPTEFFAKLDGVYVYVLATGVEGDTRRFEYWRLSDLPRPLGRRLAGPASDAFLETEVEWT